MNEELIISDRTQLCKLKGFKRKYKRIYLKIPQLDIDENVKWTNTINEEYLFKGMKTAILYITISIAAGCVAMITYYTITEIFPSEYLKYWGPIALFMGGIGWYIGKIHAHIRLNRSINILSKMMG